MHDRSDVGVGWKTDDVDAYNALCDTIDALAWAEDNELVVVERLTGPDEGSGGLPEGDFLGLTDREPHPGGVIQLPQWFWLELIRRNERPYTGPRPGEDPWQHPAPPESDAPQSEAQKSDDGGEGSVTRLNPKHERMLRDAQPVDQAAYDGED